MVDSSRMNNALDVLISEAQRLGLFERVNTYESKSQVGSGLSAEVVWMSGPTPVAGRSGLAVTSARIIYGCRIMLDFKTTPEDSIDGAIINAVNLYVNALHGELDLADPLGSHIDVFGMGGVSIDAQGGYLTLDNITYRIATIIIPILMDDFWAQVD